MAAENPAIDISDNPALRQVVEELRASNTSRSVVVDDQVVATLVPATNTRLQPKRARRTGAGRNAWLLDLVGSATGPDDGIRDVAEHHDRYLADASATPRH